MSERLPHVQLVLLDLSEMELEPLDQLHQQERP